MNSRVQVQGRLWIIAIPLILLFQRSCADVTEITGCDGIPNVLNVNETTGIGFTLAVVKSVSCFTIKNPDRFKSMGSLVPGEWKIKVDKSLDLEKTKRDTYVVEVECCSQGKQSTEHVLNVVVSSVNEFAPEFKEPLVIIDIPESTSINSTIYEINKDNPAQDQDYNPDTISYSIEQGKTDVWHIDNLLLGSIVLKKSLDFEAQQNFTLNISAQELNSAEKKRNYFLLIINVLDVDDKNPEFEHDVYNLTIPEGNYAGRCFETHPPVNAYDGDRNLNEPITYAVTEENDAFKSLFLISTNGSLCVKKKIEKGNYPLSIKAMQKDKPDFRMAFAVINLIVTDINDHRPVMNKDHYNARISEGATVGTIVLVLSASDQDEGMNADFEFKLEGEESAKFEILRNQKQGLLKVKENLDREDKEVYNFQIYAQETKSKERESSAKSNITVHVLDENDNSPKFTQPDSISISENYTIGMSVIQVRADDADKGEAGVITYSLLQTPSSDLFAIDPVTGTITLNGSLDYEKTKDIVLIVKAQDRGKPPRNSLTTVSITVDESEFSPPKFTKRLYLSSLPENKEPGFLMKLNVKDPDTKEKDLAFSFSKSDSDINSFFSIDQDGTVKTRRKFNAEKVTHFYFGVTVSDGHSRDHANVNISIVDINEFPPDISMPPNVTIFENSTLGMVVITIKITDQDRSNETFNVWLDKDQGIFYLDPETYDISIAAPIDRMIQTEYVMIVNAADLGEPSFSSKRQFKVIIADSNTAPIFVDEHNGIASNYTFYVKENVALNHVIGSVHAIDKDNGSSGIVLYQIKSAEPTDHFIIDKNSGQLKVNKILNFEENKIYNLVIKASDNTIDPKTATVKIQIHVSDIDEKPSWPSSSLKVYMTQSSVCSNSNIRDLPKDVAILVATGDEKIEYFLLNMTAEFSLINISGLLINKKRLQPGTYVLGIKACSSGKNDTCSDASLAVMIKSDSLLAFCQGFYQKNVSESIPMNSRLLKVTINKHPDDVVYSIVSGNDDKSFKLDRRNGELFTAKHLDRENIHRHVIIIKAESESLSEKTETQVIIEVLDEPDSPPIFTSSSYKAEVKENVNNTKILQVSASDADENHQQISYSIDGNIGLNGLFKIHADGSIWVTHAIDYEDPGFNHTLTFMVFADDGYFSSNATVTIHVIDENDEVPVFDALPQNVSVPENVKFPYTVLTVNASDKDYNDRIIFSMELFPSGQMNPFYINPLTGILNVGRSLDGDIIYVIQITARDLVNHQATANLSILVADENDNSPKFSSSSYNMTIEEGSGGIGASITLQVSDDDKGRNSDLSCSIPLGNENGTYECKMIHNSEVLLKTVKELEWSPTHNKNTIQITATDAGSPQRSGTCIVNVLITDINDHPPVFSMLRYNANITEDAQNETKILVPEFSVTDGDGDVYGKPSIVFNIVKNDRPFSINTTSGEIFVCYKNLVASFDREITPVYNITIVATDGGRKSSNVTVKITIIDVDDSAPYFLKDKYEFEVIEDSKFGFIIGKVEAKDKDTSSQTIFYNMEEKSTQELPFTLQQSTGELLLVGTLNADVKRQYNFTISANDGKHNSSVEIVVSVMKRKDSCRPMFNDSVSENQAINSVFYNLPKENTNYTMDDAKMSKVVNVSSSGSVSLLESVATLASPLKFNVNASNGDTHCVFLITLDILRSNDYAPKICFPEECGVKNITFNLPENSPKNTIIGVFNISDDDLGSDGEITLKLDPRAVNNYISIEDHLPILKLKEKIELTQLKADSILLEDTNTVVFNLTATDKGTPPKSAMTTIHVKILPSSKSQPRFSQNEYQFDILEGQRKGVYLGKVSVSPGDVSYSLTTHIDPIPYFNISDNGKMFTTKELDRESQTMHRFVVTAVAKTGDKLSAATLIVVNVMDINDNKPEFKDNDHSITIKENEVKNNIFEVSASDPDEGLNGSVTYSLLDGSIFSINCTSGMVSLITKIDRETTPSINLVIMASDKGSPSLISKITVSVDVEDVNDEAPVFSSHSFTKAVNENEISNQDPILQVSATDKDEGENGHIFYTLKQVGNHVFTISPLSGKIYSIFPAVKSGTFDLTIIAIDSGNPPLSTSANVTIIVSSDFSSSPPPSLELTPTIVDLFVGMAKGTDINVTIEMDNSVKLNFAGNPRPFKLENKRIVLDENLENVFECTLTLKATNPNGQVRSKKLKVRVLPLKFDKRMYIAQVQENMTVPFEILDLNSYAEKESIVEVYYSLLTQTEFVTIDRKNGTLFSKRPIDREEINIITLNVSLQIDPNVIPKASSSATNEATVMIHVMDINDEKPSFEFQRSNVKFSVSSDVNAGHAITTVRAFDDDIDGENSKIKYKILSENNAAVSINPESGILSIHNPAALSKEGNLNLTIQACNVNKESFCDTITIELTISKNPDFHLVVPITRELFKEHQKIIMQELDSVLGYDLSLTHYDVHKDQNGAVDTTRADIFFHAYKPNSNKTIPNDELSEKVRSKQKEINAIFGRFITIPKATTSEELSLTAIIALIAVACAIFFASLVAIVVVCRLSKKQKDAQKKEESALKARQNGGVNHMSDPEEPLELLNLDTSVQSKQERVLTLSLPNDAIDMESEDHADDAADPNNSNSLDSGNISVKATEPVGENSAVNTDGDMNFIQIDEEKTTSDEISKDVENCSQKIEASPDTNENNQTHVDEHLETKMTDSDRPLKDHNNFFNNKQKTGSEAESFLKNFETDSHTKNHEGFETNQISNNYGIYTIFPTKLNADDKENPYSVINDENNKDSATMSKPVLNIKNYSKKPEEISTRLNPDDTVTKVDPMENNINRSDQMNEMYPVYSSAKKVHSNPPMDTIVNDLCTFSNGNTCDEEQMDTYL